MPLTIVQVGRRVRFLAVEEGSGMEGRLAAMGLFPGVEIEVLKNSLNGPFLVGVNGTTRIVLGRGIAGKIRVA